MISCDRRVVQATAWFPPHNTGGTEYYLEGLIEALRRRGIESTVLVPRDSTASERYEHFGTRVETYPVNETPGAGEINEGRAHDRFDDFLARLTDHRGAIYHQHAWTRGCGPQHLKAARKAGMRTVVTVHVAGNICLRGSMLKFGVTACNGRINEQMCGACWAESRGMPSAMATSIVRLPRSVANWSLLHGRGRLATAIGTRAVATQKLAQLRDMFDNADRIVAVCDWVRESLVANGAPAAKLVLSRHGVSPAYRQAAHLAAKRATPPSGGPLRLLFLGRWDAAKGIDVIVRAVRGLPQDLDVRLSIRAVSNTSSAECYEAAVRALAHGDRRIAIEPAVPREGLAELMAQYDALLVPSVVMETGPLVVLEAQAAGVFVMGSRLGGISELIVDGDGGQLVTTGDVRAWTEAIAGLVTVRRRDGLAGSTRPIRTMDAAADDMVALYGSLQ
jgi:glycosyltransferase involved in cell wall biosynthesis